MNHNVGARPSVAQCGVKGGSLRMSFNGGSRLPVRE